MLQAAILGVVQGLTEFIPVSSSAHLVLVPAALGWPMPTVGFDVFLHLGTLVALVLYFYKDLVSLFNPTAAARPGEMSRRTLLMIVIASAVTGAIALAGRNWFEEQFQEPRTVGALLLVTAGLLLAGQLFSHGERPLDGMRPVEAAIIGIAQGLAVMPGVSRSGATICGGLFLGFERQLAARFAFVLGVPAVLGATLVKIVDILRGAPVESTANCLVGFLTAALTGYLGIEAVMAIVRRASLVWLAFYCVLVGMVAASGAGPFAFAR